MSYPLEVMIKMAVAVVMGGVVGWQREAQERPAGLRTHVLVCVGAAVYTLASLSFSERSDPSRVASQVATGMGFLGAGTIIRHGNIVRGLTTAASLWAVAAVGICAALGGRAYWVAGVATIAVLATLTVLRRVELRLLTHGRYAHLTLRLPEAATRVAEVQSALAARGLKVDSVQVSDPVAGARQELEIGIRLPDGADFGSISAEVSRMDGFASLRQE
jgi:putative Mg2+ transporter-C (MgtC) family protein